jgi:hypothetical protein
MDREVLRQTWQGAVLTGPWHVRNASALLLAVGGLGVALLVSEFGVRDQPPRAVVWLPAWLLLCVPLIELPSRVLRRRRWMRDRQASKVFAREQHATFEPGGLRCRGPFAEALLAWEGLDRIWFLPTGLLLRPENGVLIFLPRSGLVPSGSLDELRARLRSANVRVIDVDPDRSAPCPP